MATNFVPNGVVQSNAITFEDSMQWIISRLATGRLVIVKDGQKAAPYESISCDQTTGFVTLIDVLATTSMRVPQFTVATMPAAGTKGRIIFTTDDNNIRVDNGASYVVLLTTGSFPLLAPDGTAAAPSYAFTNDAGMGLWRQGAGIVSLSTSTVERFRLSTVRLSVSGDLGLGSVTAPDVTLARVAANVLAVGSNAATDNAADLGNLTNRVRQIFQSGTANWNKGTDVVSAATINIGTDGNYFDVTGNTGASALPTRNAGVFIALRFTGTPLLTHSATFALAAATNYQVVAGDRLLFISRGAGTWEEQSRTLVTASAASTGEFFGTGSGGAITDNGGGTVIRNGITNATTYSLGAGVATTLTHDIGRALHMKASTSITLGANATVSVVGKGSAGGGGGAVTTGGARGTGAIAGGGGGGGGEATGVVNGGTGGGGVYLLGTFDPLGVINATSTGFNGGGGSVLGAVGRVGVAIPTGWPKDTGFAALVPYGPGAGGGGGAGGVATAAGGAGGAGGGFVVMETPAITYTAGFVITAAGGAGTNGANDSGGGGGGGGGTVVVRRRTTTGAFAATVTGGAAGTAGGGTGLAGGAGAAGISFEEVLP